MIHKISMEYDVNREQAEALDININTGLKAGAGSGKTRVLSKRYFRILKEIPSVEIDSIAAITFTRKAAVEMKERIRLEIYKEIKKEKNKEKKLKWKTLRDLISTANINTIHSFCASLLKDNFALLGIDPLFTIIEEVDAMVKLHEFAEEAIMEYTENRENDNILNGILEKYGTGIISSGTLYRDIVKLYLAIRGKISFEAEMEKYQSFKPEEDDFKSMAVDILKNLHEKYEIFKNKKNCLDFSDIEILSEKLLNMEDVKNRYFRKFRYFLVDEFQDVNPLQEKILLHLTEKDNKILPGRLFIVGDHKQSIYGFRGADYKIFDRVCGKIGENGVVKSLSNCYRSTSNIVHTVNTIFEKLIVPFERLNLSSEEDKEQLKVQIITWEKEDLKKGEDSWKRIKELIPDDSRKGLLKKELQLMNQKASINQSKKDYQGDVIAGLVKKITGEFSDGKGKFSYKDIAILLRSRTNLMSIENALHSRNIPYCVLGGLGFWKKTEISDIMSFYKYIFNPSDIISFLSVLRSPIMGFSDDMIFNLMETYKDEKKPLLDYLSDFSEKSGGHGAFLAERAINIFGKCLKLRGTSNSCELMKRLCHETDYEHILLSLPEGEQKYRNLEKLFSLVLDFERKNIYNPGELPLYMALMEEKCGMEEEAFIDTEDSDAVKILTIHASKGLEFPAVIIPDMDRNIDSMAKRNKSLFVHDEEKGIITIGINEKGEVLPEADPVYNEFHKRQIAKENNDSRRIFYVAATRAKRYLAFVGENQEIPDSKDSSRMNTLMMQMKWALKDRIPETLEILDGESFIIEKTKRPYPPDFVIDAISNIEEGEYNTYEKTVNSPAGFITISRYQKYIICPRLYYFQYIAGLNPELWTWHGEDGEEFFEEEKKTGSVLRGNIVHEILSNLDSFSDKEMNEKIDKLIKEKISDNKSHSYLSEDEIRTYIVNYLEIEKKLRKEIKGKYIKSFYEFKFLVPVEGNFILNGIADRVDLYENKGNLEAVVIEYKTDTVKNIRDINEKVEFYKKQVCVYMYAIDKIKLMEGVKTSVKNAYIYFLNRGLYGEIEKNDGEIEALRKEMLNSSKMLLGMEAFSSYVYNESKACSWCEYKALCVKLKGFANE